ncbi:hypothetical protein R0K19_20965, partial [Bacillus sp. SIMBA_161]
MPTYAYWCPECEQDEERLVPVEERNDQRCHTCHMLMPRNYFAEHASTRGDYVEPVLSEAAGVMPDQVAEHRRRHPDVPMT